MITVPIKIVTDDDGTKIMPDIPGIEDMCYKAYYSEDGLTCQVEIIEE